MQTPTINVSGFRLDTETGEWLAPKLWKHEKFGIGQMVDAIISDNEVWVIVVNFGEDQPRKIRQDKLQPYGGVLRMKLGASMQPIKIEEPDPELLEPKRKFTPSMQPRTRRLSDEEILRRLRE